MIAGITGLFGSGKTTISKIFEECEFKVIDADRLSHKILASNKSVFERITKEFGRNVLGDDKKINRKKLGGIVFADSSKLKKLNSIMHPLIIKEIKNEIKKIQKKDCNIIIDAPLLLETDAKNLVEKIITVKTDFDVIVSRALKNGFTKERVSQIIGSQMPINEKTKLADFVIDNSGSLEETREQVRFFADEMQVIPSKKKTVC